ncbi:hypothetical protein AAFC00_001488 [Neodothiora populina]|uniref:Glutamyl-tRNA(Gln) amidotransferase subunit A, mitochondrial n=1 Tax=Neodothiora populina TaxID=2781224 RepID=A0ABR3PQ50_9PEZI
MSMNNVHRIQQCIGRQAKHAELNAFVSLADAKHVLKLANDAEESRLHGGDGSTLRGKLIAIKDNIATKSLRTTASSEILDDYTSPYDATVVSHLISNGAILAGKTNMDEFGMGSHSRSPFTGTVLNHLRRNGSPLSAGGSSGGSAVAVATGQCWAALGTDTGGSVRLPAAYTGTVGFKPSYGRLSRWGVIAYANSLDTVGTLTSNVDDARTLYHCLDRHDPRDPTSLSPSFRSKIKENSPAFAATSHRAKTLRIGVPREYNTTSLSSAVKGAWARLLRSLQDAGHSIHPVSLPSTQQALPAYYVLAPAEASSNLARYDGVRYGFRTTGPDASPSENLPLFARTRGEGFGAEVQRRILLGAYTLSSEAMDNYFVQAQKVRRLIQRDFDRVFSLQNPLHDEDSDGAIASSTQVDVLIAPTAPTLPPSLAEVDSQTPFEAYMNDVLTVPASLAGLPAISVPISKANGSSTSEGATSIGMQVIGQFGDDEMVMDVGELIENMQQSD